MSARSVPTLPDAGGRCRGDGGTGLIASAAGVLAFVAFVLFATQLLVALHLSTTVGAVADEGALRAASATVDHTDPMAVAAARRRAEQHMRTLLGPQAEVTTFDWSASTAEDVVLVVRTDAPRLMFGFQGSLVTDHLERTAVVRVETLQ